MTEDATRTRRPTPPAAPQAGGMYTPTTMLPMGPVVVATDGGPSAEAALRAGALMAQAWGTAIELLAVLPEREPTYGGVALGLEPPPPVPRVAEDERLRPLRDLAGRVLVGARWHLVTLAGDPARMIAREAAQRRSPLVVMGHGAPPAFGRLVGSDVVLRTIRLASCPVLAVSERWRVLPRRVVAALDFSLPSVWAAEIASRMMQPEGVLELVHVAPVGGGEGPLSAWEAQYHAWADDRFARVRGILGPTPTVLSRTRLTSGDVVPRLVERAQDIDVGMLAVGSSGMGRMERLLVGSVTTAMVRHARCAVLVAPPPPVGEADRLAALMGVAVEHRDEGEWAAALDAFSRRNAGRTATMETLDPGQAAYAQEEGYAFRGASYDTTSRRVSLMLSGGAEPTCHLTRSIGGVKSIAMHADRRGREAALLVWHGEGLTELRLGDVQG